MNFQSVSTAEKLPTSDGLAGGYLADGVTPGPLLAKALDFVNTQVGRITSAVHFHNLDSSTTVILSAKHGQSPENAASADPDRRRRHHRRPQRRLEGGRPHRSRPRRSGVRRRRHAAVAQ